MTVTKKEKKKKTVEMEWNSFVFGLRTKKKKKMQPILFWWNMAGLICVTSIVKKKIILGVEKKKYTGTSIEKKKYTGTSVEKKITLA